jgi:hypothetical protein
LTRYDFVPVRGGVEKTRLLEQRIILGALEPAVRDVATRLIAGTGRNDHVERIARLHRFVRDSVDYYREPIEMFQSPTLTLERGGDCDDLVILLGSLGWALRYPWAVEPVGDPDNPEHYSLLLGWPASDEPHGDPGTRWIQTEAAVAAALGEHPRRAGERRAPL